MTKGQKDFQKIIENIEGWLFPGEAEALFNFAKYSKYPIVEIGAWKGKSTITLALGSKAGKQSKVFSIDPHTGSIEHQVEGKPIDTYPEYIENLTKVNVLEQVTPLVMTSEEAVKDFKESIGLLFIDGSHEYEDVKKDFQLWVPLVVDNGYICLHDSNWPGVIRVLREELTSEKFYNIQQVNTMVVAQKKSKEDIELTIPKIPIKRVIIATPTDESETISVWHESSLIQSMKLSPKYNVELFPLCIPYDEYIQRARNDLISIAMEVDIDELVWIDSDISWKPEDLFKLLNYEVDVVGGVYPKKLDQEEYPVQVLSKTINIDSKTKLFEVDGLGTGFLKLSKKALKSLWDTNPEYKHNGRIGKWICDVLIQDGKVHGEDIILCQKLRNLGYKIYLDPNINCDHVGTKKYNGNFVEYISKLVKKVEEEQVHE